MSSLWRDELHSLVELPDYRNIRRPGRSKPVHQRPAEPSTSDVRTAAVPPTVPSRRRK